MDEAQYPSYGEVSAPFDSLPALTYHEVSAIVLQKQRDRDKVVKFGAKGRSAAAAHIENVASYTNDILGYIPRDAMEQKRHSDLLRSKTLRLEGQVEGEGVYLREFEVASILNLQPRTAQEAVLLVPWLRRYDNSDLALLISEVAGGFPTQRETFFHAPPSPYLDAPVGGLDVRGSAMPTAYNGQEELTDDDGVRSEGGDD